jgi:hypothetical protein
LPVSSVTWDVWFVPSPLHVAVPVSVNVPVLVEVLKLNPAVAGPDKAQTPPSEVVPVAFRLPKLIPVPVHVVPEELILPPLVLPVVKSTIGVANAGMAKATTPSSTFMENLFIFEQDPFVPLLFKRQASVRRATRLNNLL